ncbi:MAG TPA: AMP-binding protein [Coxiellaceae bacterium]|nr:AMP-binding protein [Coxiellaceae bacterium]
MHKIWLRSYPPGVPENVDVDEYHSLVELLESSIETYGDHLAFSSMGTSLTYNEFHQKINQLARFFQHHLKLQKGDRIALMLPNILQYPISLFAALKVGLIVVNVNPLYMPEELLHQLHDAKPKAIVVLKNVCAKLKTVLPQTSVEQVIVTGVGDSLGLLKGGLINLWMVLSKRQGLSCDIGPTFSFKQALRIGKNGPWQDVVLQPEDTAFLQYTGGTTGVAKGAVLTHHNIVSNVMQSVAWVKSLLEPGKEIAIIALPLYHVFSLTVSCFAFLYMGAQGVLIANPRDLARFMACLKTVRPSIFVGINTLFQALLDEADFHELDFQSYKITIAGGMATQKQVVERWKQLTGMTIIEGYGLTEASPVVSINPVNLNAFNHSIGLPIPNTQVEIRDEQHHPVAIGNEGELWVRGPQVMKGYWEKPEETKKVLDTQGWLATGDMARMDEAGFLYLVDRKKDMIIVSGFKVYPNEVEEVILHHPEVKEVGVVGESDPHSGEIVHAFVVRTSDHLTEEALMQFCAESLTGYKRPKKITFVESLPKSTVGKILRRELKKLLLR